MILDEVQQFGDALIQTQDLDPVYVGLTKADLPKDQLHRLLISYWMFYHIGAAAWFSEHEGDDFWKNIEVAARNELTPRVYELPSDRWPRAAERRHFRGKACLKSVDFFRQRPPEHWVQSLFGLNTETEIMAVAQRWPLFGPWISFKIADMMERVVGIPVQFDPDIGLLYSEPRKMLDLCVAEGGHDATWWYTKLAGYFSARLAPPREDRSCGPQELETICCKFKSMRGGHYWVGKDIHEQRAALQGWGATAQKILNAYPSEVAGNNLTGGSE